MSNLNELKPIINLNPFARFCCTIGNLPSSYMASLTYEEQLMWFCDYLQNTVIPAVNNNAECVKELQELYVKLKDYVDNYFNNLDVQQEINNKLDNMALDGSLTSLIANYVNPFINSQNETIANNNTQVNKKIDESISLQNLKINNLDSKIDSVASGSPLVASSVEQMTDTSKIYVNTSDGHWYWFNNDTWQDGGIYQASSINPLDPTIKQINSNLNILSINNYHPISLLLRAGTINQTGGDSNNTDFLNTDCRSEFIFARKGSFINTSSVNTVIFFFDNNFNFIKQVTVEAGQKYLFENDSVIKFRIRGSSNLNERTNINETLTSEELVICNSYINFIACADSSSSLQFGVGSITTGYMGGTGKYAISKILYLEKCYLYLPNLYQANICKINNDGTFEIKSSFTNNKFVKITENGFYVIQLYNPSNFVFDENLYNLPISIISKDYINRGLKNKTELVYHRGLSAFYPENTLPSFGAVKKFGGNYIECDIQVTKDDYMICIHDSTVDRTTSGTGNVADLTLAQIKDFYITNGYQVSIFNNTLRVPTIKDVIAFCSFNNLIPIIELKTSINYHQLITYLKNYNLYDDAIIISYSLDYLLDLRNIDSHILIALLADNYSPNILYNATKLGPNSGIDLNVKNYSITNINIIHSYNLFVGFFVSDNINILEEYSGADFITTNRIIDANNINWNNQVLNYLPSVNNFNTDYDDSVINLFQDVINISGFVKFDNDSQLITIGDQTYKPSIIGNWYYINLSFIKRNPGNVSLDLQCQCRELIIRKFNYK